MKEIEVRMFTGWTASELWRVLHEDVDWKSEDDPAPTIAAKVHAWHPAGGPWNEPNGRPAWNMGWFDKWGDTDRPIPLTHEDWRVIDELNRVGAIEWGGRVGDLFNPTETESRIFDWYSIGDFQGELHYEGLPDYDNLQLERPDLRPSLEAACREGFTHEGFEHLTDADRREIWRISEKIIDEGGGNWIDNGEALNEGGEPDFSSPEDPDYDDPTFRTRTTHHTGIRVTLTAEEWAFIDSLPLSCAQDWETGRLGAPDEMPWNDPQAYWEHVTNEATKAVLSRSTIQEVK